MRVRAPRSEMSSLCGRMPSIQLASGASAPMAKPGRGEHREREGGVVGPQRFDQDGEPQRPEQPAEENRREHHAERPAHGLDQLVVGGALRPLREARRDRHGWRRQEPRRDVRERQRAEEREPLPERVAQELDRAKLRRDALLPRVPPRRRIERRGHRHRAPRDHPSLRAVGILHPRQRDRPPSSSPCTACPRRSRPARRRHRVRLVRHERHVHVRRVLEHVRELLREVLPLGRLLFLRHGPQIEEMRGPLPIGVLRRVEEALERAPRCRAIERGLRVQPFGRPDRLPTAARRPRSSAQASPQNVAPPRSPPFMHRTPVLPRGLPKKEAATCTTLISFVV